MRPLPHKISQLNQFGSPSGKLLSSSSSSPLTSTTMTRTVAVNPYLPSGSPGLIRRQRFTDSNASSAVEGRMCAGIPTMTTRESDGAAARFGAGIRDNDAGVDGVDIQSRILVQSSPSERRLSNQSQSSIDSPANSSPHHPNNSNTHRSSSPSPAKAKPPPPPRRSSLCKSDKNFI